MRELSLFTGAGGGVLGTQLLGWECLGYVEIDDYCQRILRRRMDDGLIRAAPLFGDIKTFIACGYADMYSGMVDVVTAGFPCQPFSVAGKRAGADDPRNMWPATIECIRRVRPRFAFLENVPGLISNGYFGTVIGDLTESGYDCRWRVLSAAEVGAPHKRARLWIVADARSGRRGEPKEREIQQPRGAKTERASDDSYTNNAGQHPDQGRETGNDARRVRPNVPDTNEFDRRARAGRQDGAQAGDGRSEIPDARCGNGEGPRGEISGETTPAWWDIEPDVGRVANGVANRVDRLKAIGNGQVPAVVKKAWELLS